MSLGIMQSMKLSLEQNRALLKSKKSLKNKLQEKGIELKTPKKLEFKEVSEEELKAIKAKIRQDYKRSRRLKLMVFSIIAVIIVILFYFMMS